MVAGLMLTWTIAMVWEAATLDHKDLLGDKPDNFLLVHVWGLGVLGGVAWIIMGTLVSPDARWLIQRLAASRRRS